MDQPITHEIHASARRYYRQFCQHVAHYLSFFGHNLEPYARQNKFISYLHSTKPSSDLTTSRFSSIFSSLSALSLPFSSLEPPYPSDLNTIIHLRGSQKHVCKVYKLTVEGEIYYAAYVGDLSRDLANVKRFYSIPVSRERSLELYDGGKKNAKEDNSSQGKMESNMEDMIKATFAGLKTNLDYMDPLKEYLCVTVDREGKVFDIHAEFEDNPVTTEPTFEDVMTLWVAVLIWSAQMVVFNKPYTQTASRITGKIYALIKQSGEVELD